MKKLLALAMAALLLVSTTGVTVACMVCEQTGKPVTTCHKCGHTPRAASISAKSCCVASTHRIAVTDSFSQPAQPALFVPAAFAAHPVSTTGSLVSAPSRSTHNVNSLIPASAREYCALTSIFRI